PAGIQQKLESEKESVCRAIQKELKIKEGAENLRRATKDKKNLAHVETALKFVGTGLSNTSAELELQLRLEELRHRLRIEAAVAEGAKNVVKILSGRRVQDRKMVAEAQACLQESSQKIDLFRLALEHLLSQLSPDHPKRGLIKQELTDTFSLGVQQLSPTLIKPSALTGGLLVRLVGCEDLLEKMPGRSRVATSAPVYTSSGDFRLLTRTWAGAMFCWQASSFRVSKVMEVSSRGCICPHSAIF
ncbi:hypothetical protein Chor_001998, partial [Crotalus horridus]